MQGRSAEEQKENHLSLGRTVAEISPPAMHLSWQSVLPGEIVLTRVVDRVMLCDAWLRGQRYSWKTQVLWGAWLLVVLCCAGSPALVRAQGAQWEHYMAEGAKAYQQGQETNAEMFYLAALEDVEKAGPEDPRLAATLNTLAVLYHAQRRYAQAESFYQRVLRLLEQTIGPEHPTLATTLNNLAVVYESQGQYGAAEPLYQRALTLLEHTLGPEHPNLAAALGNYADLLRKMQREAEAEAAESRAQAIWAKHKREPAEK